MDGFVQSHDQKLDEFNLCMPLFVVYSTISRTMAGHSSFSQSVPVIDLNNGNQRSAGRQVIVTPITSTPQTAAMQQAHVAVVNRRSSIDKVFLKAVSKENSKDAKTFALRHINTTKVSTSDELKKCIKQQLGNDVNDWEVMFKVLVIVL